MSGTGPVSNAVDGSEVLLEVDGGTSGEKKRTKKGQEKNPGVVYIGNPPAFMKPVKVRHLLEQHGEVSKLYLSPEDPAVRRRRKKSGGSGKIKYTEGWVEFADKKTAKVVARALNGTPVGGHRRSFHFETLWTLKYLSSFEWAHLTERQAYERRIKAVKLRAEISQAKRESEHYLEKVAQEKSIQRAFQRSEAEEQEQLVRTSDERTDYRSSSSERKRKALRTFKQLEPREEYTRKKKRCSKAEEAEKEDLLANIFT